MNEAVDGFALQTSSLHEAMDVASQHHISGRLQEAEGIYQQILRVEPDNPLVLHLLGVIAHQVGKNDIAVDLIDRAIGVNPNFAEAHYNLSLALQKLNRAEEAIDSLRSALALSPDYSDAYIHLGLILKQLNRLDEAVACYRQLLAIKPDFAQAQNNLGNTLRAMGNLAEAAECFEQAISINPAYTEAHNNLGLVLVDQERPDEAIGSYQRALEVAPEYPEVHFNRGNAFKELNKLSDAKESYNKALALQPNFAEAHTNLGNLFRELNDLESATASCQKALAIDPLCAEAHNNLGLVLQEQNKLTEAGVCFLKAISLKPDFADAHVNLAIYFWIKSEWDGCLDVVIRLSKLDHSQLSRKRLRFVVSYAELFEKLLMYRDSHLPYYEDGDDFPPLYVVGESHCLPPAHTVISVDNRKHRSEPKLIVGCKAWHLANPATNKYKAQFERHANSFIPGSTAVVMFGEIDCRHDEGILAYHKKSGNDLHRSVTKLIKSYVAYVLKVFSRTNITPIFYGVPARPLHTVTALQDDADVLARVINKFNSVLAKETRRKHVRFLDVHSFTNDDNGYSSGRFHLDKTHLLPSVLEYLLR